MNLAVNELWPLYGLIVILIPVFDNGVSVNAYPSTSVLPVDGLSAVYSALLKLLAVVAMCGLLLGMAGLHRTQQQVERIGRGANITILLDRSNSMDHTFAGKAPGGGEESKSMAARRLLSQFITQRQQGRIGLAAYSTGALPVMPLTDNRAVIQAAIAATDTPALAYTNISKGLELALSYFDDEDNHAENIILLVSDGAAAIDEDNKRLLRRWLKQRPVRLYWIFLRSQNSPGLYQKPENSRDDNAQVMPERYLHLFFSSLNIPYQAFQAENSDAMAKAMLTIDKLENRPLHYFETLPRQDLSGFCYAVSAGLILLLIGLKGLEVRS